MPMDPGSRVGTYEITASLGAGGMGEVYRARDTRLNRDVAVKVRFAVVRTLKRPVNGVAIVQSWLSEFRAKKP